MVREVKNNIRSNWITYIVISVVTGLGTSIGNSAWSRVQKIAATPEQFEELKGIVLQSITDGDRKLAAAVSERNDFIRRLDTDSKARDDALQQRYMEILREHAMIRQSIQQITAKPPAR